MGRSKAKKTGQPSLDFQVKKKKLGKKAPPNPNATVTTFKSKTLFIPAQSISGEKEDQMVNHRNMTLKDLLSKMKHYSEQVKKDALNGVRDLIQQHPKIVHMHISAIMNGTVELVNDVEKNVRAAAYSLLAQVLPLLDPVMISPFVPLFSVYVSSGMTHLKTSIRMDALRIFELLLDQYPRQITAHSHQMIPNYMDLLRRVSVSTSHTMSFQSTSATAASLASAATQKTGALSTRIQILRSMNKLLMLLVLPPDNTFASLLNGVLAMNQDNTPWAPIVSLRGEFRTYDQRRVFNDLFSKNQVTASISSSTLSTSIDNNGSTKKNKQQQQQQQDGDGAVQLKPMILENSGEVMLFTKTLMPVLIECWLELSPSNPALPHSSLEDMELILRIIHLLIQNLKIDMHGTKDFDRLRQDYIKYFAVHFPFFVGSAANPDSKEWITSNAINSVVAQTLAHFMGLQCKKPLTSLPEWFTPALEFLEEALDGKLIESNLERSGQAVRSSIADLLWIVPRILPVLQPESSQSLLQAFIKFDEHCHPHSSAKKSCVFFIKELVDTHSKAKDRTIKKIIEWGLASLPKLLWKLGTTDPNTSLIIIHILLSLGKDQTKRAQYDSIHNAFVPFFFTITKGTQQQPNGKQIYGPFVQLPFNVQTQALNLIYYFSSISMLMIRSLIAICRYPGISHDIVDRVLEIFYHKQSQFGLTNYLAFCFAVTMSMSQPVEKKLKSLEGQDTENNDEPVDLDGDQTMVDVDMDKSKATNSNKRKTMENNEEGEEAKQRDRLREKATSRIFRDINNLRTSIAIDKLLVPLSESILNELSTPKTMVETKGLLEMIYACFDAKDNEEWAQMPEELLNKLPITLANFLYDSANSSIIEMDLVVQFVLLDQSNSLLLHIFRLLKDRLNSNDTKLTTLSHIFIELSKQKTLEDTLMDDKVQSKVTELVKLVHQRSSGDVQDKQVSERMVSEMQMLYNKLVS
ncbi:hypothetical protein SAMD00019534_081770 [Acytostelium subglobosum LB1]|uniref:hypothetical protein n=1 Tax=Acytostelium subglobosum LB1 TaxID=1410327 RepID=UPI0006448EBF|nr:hypothetical protein SAMD00019534_081770 [Acytostelium subglobosum LB1]GAM25002.1 hypothetical protein SAMD00019534_081770 [Acytostelium subglobosum LB1]|eukprot:XP_012752091.1 hypothetical protein SAMD00019534_081770 [Acytostelium subglobosum LB1]